MYRNRKGKAVSPPPEYKQLTESINAFLDGELDASYVLKNYKALLKREIIEEERKKLPTRNSAYYSKR